MSLITVVFTDRSGRSALVRLAEEHVEKFEGLLRDRAGLAREFTRLSWIESWKLIPRGET